MQGYFFIEVQDNQITTRGRILESVGNGNYAVQFFDQDGKPNPLIPVRILNSSNFGSFNLFPTAEHANAWLQAVTNQEDAPAAPKKGSRRTSTKKGTTKRGPGRPPKAPAAPSTEG